VPSLVEAAKEAAGIAAAAMPMPPVRRKSRRRELNELITIP